MPDARRTPGIDVSKHQGTIDWREVAGDGIRFAYIKASEGVGYRDPKFDANILGAQEAGIRVGAYHFARVSRGDTIDEDAVAEAGWFHEVAGDVDGLPAALDVEWDKKADGISPRDVVRWCRTFVVEWLQRTGEHPVIYTGYNFWRWKLARTTDLSNCPLWLVNYTTSDEPKRSIPGWPTRFWQHSCTGRVSGIAGSVDLDWFFGTEEELAEL